jgi:hypothetical protein
MSNKILDSIIVAGGFFLVIALLLLAYELRLFQ